MAKRFGPRARGSAGVGQFRRDNRFYYPLEVFSGNPPANARAGGGRFDRAGRLVRDYEYVPSILSIGIDLDDFSFEDLRHPAINLDEFAFSRGTSGSIAWHGETLGDSSSRVSEGIYGEPMNTDMRRTGLT